MADSKLKYVGMIVCCATVAGCSSSTSSNRASLASDPNGPPERNRASRLFPGSDGISYYNGRSTRDLNANSRYSLQSAPQKYSRSQASGRLRRFAAMPRHKPHAPHVRQNEGACLNSGIVQPTAYIRPRSSIGGGQCYIARPFMMSAAARGRVKFEPAATVRCQMVPSIETWVAQVLRPAARRFLGSDVVQLRIAGSYGCRTRNHKAGAKISEHGKANALDISMFYFADGRKLTVKAGWHGSLRERRFLRYIHRGACEHFSTVLGPNADRHHRDHLHFDLARHGRRGTYRVCK